MDESVVDDEMSRRVAAGRGMVLWHIALVAGMPVVAWRKLCAPLRWSL